MQHLLLEELATSHSRGLRVQNSPQRPRRGPQFSVVGLRIKVGSAARLAYTELFGVGAVSALVLSLPKAGGNEHLVVGWKPSLRTAITGPRAAMARRAC